MMFTKMFKNKKGFVPLFGLAAVTNPAFIVAVIVIVTALSVGLPVMIALLTNQFLVPMILIIVSLLILKKLNIF